jgi:hypothetical protein
MDLDRILPGVIGAFVGVFGWLVVGLLIQRRQFYRQARSAARAVYFELDVNRMNVEVARDYGSFTPLNRASFERLLPELAMLLGAAELRTIVSAYLAHAGYQQASTDAELPPELRREGLAAVLAAHEDALNVLRRRAFNPAELRGLGQDTAPEGGAGGVGSRT